MDKREQRDRAVAKAKEDARAYNERHINAPLSVPPVQIDDFSFRVGYDAGHADAALAAADWVAINSSDDNPLLDGLYLVTLTGADDDPYSDELVREAWFNTRKEIWTSIDGGYGYDPLAYRPLPAPYQRKSEGDSK